MKAGTYVLDLLDMVPLNEKTIVVIRHSKRDSFNGIPDHLRDTVGINPDGVQMAREFGESIRQVAPDKRLLLGHTVAKRCEMTACSIKEGFSSDNQTIVLGCEPEIKSPVVNLDNLVKLRNQLGWQGLIQQWLGSELPEDTLWNPRKYTDELLDKLLNYPNVKSGDMLVVVAHDITLFPLIFSLFEKNVKAIEFLNGIVISANTDKAEIQFRNAEHSFKTECRIL
jgi:broad specificity phosphatase PhoE